MYRVCRNTRSVFFLALILFILFLLVFFVLWGICGCCVSVFHGSLQGFPEHFRRNRPTDHDVVHEKAGCASDFVFFGFFTVLFENGLNFGVVIEIKGKFALVDLKAVDNAFEVGFAVLAQQFLIVGHNIIEAPCFGLVLGGNGQKVSGGGKRRAWSVAWDAFQDKLDLTFELLKDTVDGCFGSAAVVAVEIGKFIDDDLGRIVAKNRPTVYPKLLFLFFVLEPLLSEGFRLPQS